MFKFIVGLFIGAMIGFSTAILLFVADDDDE